MKYFLFPLFCLFALSSFAQDLKTALFEMPDVIFEEIESPEHFQSAWKLSVKQPLDHKNPEAGYFYQKVYLSHMGFSSPTVIVTEGYNRNRNRIYELTDLLDANQIQVEHRFFGESIPEDLNYDYLNLEQACADYHRIRTLFKEIYQSKWICTGISKGGSTTIVYRYFYPDDVDVSVPYVAPINRTYEDERLYNFLDTIGTEACHQRIVDFQISVLKKRKEMLPLVHWYNKGAKNKFEYFTEEQGFEFAVLEYPFSFWQYGHDCSKIPDERATTEELLEHLFAISGVDFFSDDQIEYYGSHYYQAAEEMGYYGYETDELNGLITALPTTPNPHAAFVPNKMDVKFDGSLLNGVNAWLEKDAHKMIYINGALDTWSATAVPVNPKVESVWFNLAGKHHGNARIRSMSPKEKAKFVSTLENWLGIKITQ